MTNQPIRLLVAMCAWTMFPGAAESPAQTTPFRLEMRARPGRLIVGPIPEPGALFIFRAADLATLASGPEVFFQTNTPLASECQVPALPAAPDNGFFFAAHWPGRLVEQFGDPEYARTEPLPGAILMTRGAPGLLWTNVLAAVDFFVTDPAGRLLDRSGRAELQIVRRSDGAAHPDAVVTPPALELAGGHARADVQVGAATSLEGYVLGLGVGLEPVEELRAAFDLGANPMSAPAIGAVIQRLNDWRLAAVDANRSWSAPWPAATIPAGQISGTYGEWRGTGGESVHEGLDMTLPAATAVRVARGGVVSCVGSVPGQGGYVVLDHGDGWFTRYQHLDFSGVSVAPGPGQVVLRGATLGQGLYAAPGWPVHLHFEMRRSPDGGQWMVGRPGQSVDPLQAQGAFTVPQSVHAPQWEAVGLMRWHPGAFAPVKTAPEAAAAGGSPLYLFARCVDLVPGGGTNLSYRLGVRSVSFQADGMAQPVEISMVDRVQIDALRIPGTGAHMGFAKYGPLQASCPDPLEWHPYWWEWDTLAYQAAPLGPRTVTLVARGYDGAAVTNSLNFGPEIENQVWDPLGNRDFRVTLIAHLGSSGKDQAQPDQYQLEVLGPDRTPIPGVLWEGLGAGHLTPVFTAHLERGSYIFHLPVGTEPSQMIVRATSRLVPDLRHEVNQGVVRLTGRAPQAPVLVDIPEGTFQMGSPAGEILRTIWEGPQTRVTLNWGFKMGKYEVTQAQYKALFTNNPSYFSGVSNRPVEQVSWADALEYCRRLTQREREGGYLPPGWAYRLPTEAEWEYACRAGTTTAFGYGPVLHSGMANFDGRYGYDGTADPAFNPAGVNLGKTSPAGSYAPNPWGLCDMHGNVWEWCLDGWDNFLPGGDVVNPWTPVSDNNRVLRGGCWYNDGRFCRSAYRAASGADYASHEIGFRVVLARE